MAMVLVAALLVSVVSVLGQSPPGLSTDFFPDPNLPAQTVPLPYTAGDIPLTFGLQSGTNYPEQIHLSPATSNGSFFHVSWITPKNSGKGYVTYGPNNVFRKTVSCKGAPYSFGLKTNLSYTSGPIFHCLIGPLIPNTPYIYKISNYPVIYNFTSFPSVGSLNPNKSLKIGLMADVGQTYNSSTTYDHAALAGLDLVVFPGDLCYADNYGAYFTKCNHFNGTDLGFLTCGVGGLKWDSMFRLAQKLFAYVPVIFAPGNHEIEFNYNYGIYTPYIAYQARVPAQLVDAVLYPPKPPLYYSQNIGLAHIIMLSSYDAFSQYTQQWWWLQGDLAAVNRKVTPWLIVAFHSPVYNSNKGHYLEGEPFRLQNEAAFYAAKVDLVVSGHVHNYERSVPVYNEVPNPCGPTYITVGDGGNIETFSGEFLDPKPIYSFYRENSYGFSDLEIFNSTTAVYTWYRNQNATLTVSDTFVLTNKASVC